MNLQLSGIWPLVAICAVFASPLPQAASPSAAQQQLANRYMAAVRTKDRAQLQALLHPKVAACENLSIRDYFDYLAEQSLKDVPQGKYTVAVTPLPAGEPPAILPATIFKYPVRPTHQLQIDSEAALAESVSVIRTIASQEGRWYIVYPCPNAEGIKYFQRNMARQRLQRQRARALAAQLKQPLRTQLQDLLKRGRKIDAIHKYQAATGVDLTTAVQVMDLLEPHR
jgi:hypothetical protein